MDWGNSTLDLIAISPDGPAPPGRWCWVLYRPVQSLSGEHPLGAVEQDLLMHGQCERLALACFDERAVGEYLDGRCPRHALPPELPSLIHQRTGGNPLFLVNMIAP